MSSAPTSFTITVLTLGIACVGAAIVGGGVTFLGVKVPIIKSVRRQLFLLIFGLILCAAAGAPTIASVWRTLFPYETVIESFGPTEIDPGKQQTFPVSMQHAGYIQVTVESIQSTPSGKEVFIGICPPDNPGNCKTEQLGERRSIKSLVGSGDNVVNVFNFDSNPPVTVTLKAEHTK
jgi:hypothetical protein